MDEFDQLIGGIGDQLDSMFTGGSEPPTEQSESPPETVAAPDQQQTVADAAPLSDSTSSPALEEPSTQPVIDWDAPDNPYRQKAEWGEGLINKLHEQALATQQQQQIAQEQADQQALYALRQEFPNLEPEQQQFVLDNLLAWQQQKHQSELAALQNRYEPHLQKLVIDDLGNKMSLTAEERAELQQFRDPRLMQWAAQTRSEARKAADARIAEAQKEIENLKLNGQALERRGAGITNIPGTSNAGAPVDVSEATNIDDFIRGLNLFQHAG